jgi:hypothetical protein
VLVDQTEFLDDGVTGDGEEVWEYWRRGSGCWLLNF